MHFALPPRKTSQPPPYARAAARSSATVRRRRIQILGYVVLGVLTVYLLFSYLFSSTSKVPKMGQIEDDPEVVLVTMFDENTSNENHMRMIRANREDYARRHGYKTFYTNTTAYRKYTQDAPSSWAMVPSLRHAIKEHPQSLYFWYLTANALIMNPSLSLSSHIFQPLDKLMLKDIPVVPPDSVIHTFSHLRPRNIDLIISQDMENLAHTSIVIRNTPRTRTSSDNWAFYFLDAWFDPLYRTYAFQKAENHALEHIVQWHPTILTKIALIDQRKINSYNYAPTPIKDEPTGHIRTHDSMWQEGDLVINFKGCSDSKERDCQKEIKQCYSKWESEVARLGGGIKVNAEVGDKTIPQAQNPIEPPVNNGYEKMKPEKVAAGGGGGDDNIDAGKV